ncbi:MAG: hypothetical protein UW70_C0059G0002 [Candidatus Peregrinibacteria bacterium GW2011_GWA2_44_7]|nr:MAG: hypothetical protein UW70_C0059G0002 [Candidatus Peregrinibacteria bacterium GW2011_GWA2_44_7]
MALPPTYKARLREKCQLTPQVVDFFFDLLEPNTIEFKAGQFVLVKTRHPETGELLSRAYSLANPPQVFREIVLNIEILPTGKLTSLMNGWEPGREVEMQGPFGHFTFKSPEAVPVVFVATGTGIAPFKSMIEDLLSQGDKRPMTLYFGIRSQAGLFYEKELEALAAAHPNFSYHYCLSQPQEGWTGFSGRVTKALEETPLEPNTQFYLCGGKPVLDDVRAVLTGKGFEASQIYFEQYFL